MSAAFRLGIDVGSVSINTVLIDQGGRVVFEDYTRTQGRPLAAVADVLDRLPIEADRIIGVAVTGVGGQRVAELLGGKFVNEVIALTRGAAHVYPLAATIIDLGGEDAKLVLTAPGPDGGLQISDFAMNSMCAAGTGSFLDQQAHRLGLTIEDFGAVALGSEEPPRIAGRCTVFAKTDMIHLQQEATPDYDIVAGLCFALARNLKSNIGQGKTTGPPVVFAGGVAHNPGVRRALIEVLGLGEDELIVPDHFTSLPAIGAVLENSDARTDYAFPGSEPIRRRLASGQKITERLAPLRLGEHHAATDEVDLIVPDGPLRGYVGLDVGSISTNVAVIDKAGRLLARQYLMTAGRPLEAVKEGLRRVGAEIGDRLEVLGVCTTGSGRYLIGDFVGADLIKNEITAQATGALALDPAVDTIFEIGGQDSKYISLENGAIVDFTMNKVCAAGTGSFLEEQAEKLGIAIKEEFGELALAAPAPVRMGERCTVFMESDLVAHQARGAETPDLVAGLSYAIVHNYLNKVVEDRRVGQKIFYQGATAKNAGIVAAFEAVIGRPIIVPPHCDVTGAIGAARLAQQERTWEMSKFKGFGLGEVDYRITSFYCPGCENRCQVRQVKVVDEPRPLFYGSRCEKYERQGRHVASNLPDLVQEREDLLTSYLTQIPDRRKRGVVGVPRAMFFKELLPFFGVFLNELGFEVVLSPPTHKGIIHAGVEAVVNEPCFPIKVAHGHVLSLLSDGLKKIFVPHVLNMPRARAEMELASLCPYAQTLCYVLPSGVRFDDYQAELIQGPLDFSVSRRKLVRLARPLARRLGAPGRLAGRAVEAGLTAYDDFRRKILDRGRAVLDRMTDDDLGLVIVSRPYNGMDPGLNLGLPRKMGELGVYAIPMDFLDLDARTDVDELKDMYWRFGQKILAAAEIIKGDPRLYGVFITNFGCGPDSFIHHFFRDKMRQKPSLDIEVDEHSADVGAVTRLEAFLDSIKNAQKKPPAPTRIIVRNASTKSRRLFIPPMTDHGRAVAAAFRACGVPAEMLPDSDQETLRLGRRFTSGRECYPCALTTGDMLRKMLDPDTDRDQVAFFMPSGLGPCRFGQYHRYHRLVLDEAGFADVPIFAPDQSDRMYQELDVEGGDGFTRLGWNAVVAVDMIQKLQLQIRPRELSPGQTDRVYARCLEQISRTIEDRGDLVETLTRCRRAFEAIPLEPANNRPVVGVVGEIYTRANPFANGEIVRRLEAQGATVWLPPISEWIHYVSFEAKGRAVSLGRWKAWLRLMIETHIQEKDERALQELFQGTIANLDEPRTGEVLDLAAPWIDPAFKGETCLSVGKSLDFLGKGAAGIVSVVPFTCMPGTIVDAVIKRLRTQTGGWPFLNLACDGQEEVATTTRIEAFMHQVHDNQRRRARER
ncbi:MAG: CoA activase [Proteobacteria bacterium]|nr:CoA activase [Pseudomonadota bacterium]MBU1742266.1 CoA activase [Pseudomonadota bacterium]